MSEIIIVLIIVGLLGLIMFMLNNKSNITTEKYDIPNQDDFEPITIRTDINTIYDPTSDNYIVPFDQLNFSIPYYRWMYYNYPHYYGDYYNNVWPFYTDGVYGSNYGVNPDRYYYGGKRWHGLYHYGDGSNYLGPHRRFKGYDDHHSDRGGNRSRSPVRSGNFARGSRSIGHVGNRSMGHPARGTFGGRRSRSPGGRRSRSPRGRSGSPSGRSGGRVGGRSGGRGGGRSGGRK